jgi:dipicolinate synthase subunit A
MLDEQRVLLLGYGMFGKAIGWRLRALGAKVWVMARRQKQRQEAVGDGLLAVAPQQLPRLVQRVDLVLNTIPAVVLGRELLAGFPAHTLFLELASPPYGIDLPAAAELGKKVEVLPGLPAKYAPASAADALAWAVLRQLGEE